MEASGTTPSPNKGTLAWDASAVAEWITTMGLGLYAKLFIDNNVSGDVLLFLTPDDLGEMGIRSVGHRLRVLKAIYGLAVSQDLRHDQYNYYVPPTVKQERAMASWAKSGVATADGYSDIVHSFEIRDERLGYAETEIKRLNDGYHRLREDLLPLFRMAKESKPLPTPDAVGVLSPSQHQGMFSQQFYSHSQAQLSQSQSAVPATATSSVSSSALDKQTSPSSPLNASVSPSGPTSPMFTAPLQTASAHVSSHSSTATSISGAGPPKRIITKRSLAQLTNTATSSPAGDWDDKPTSVNRKPPNTGPLAVNSPSASEPFKSFRVTLEDPCYKVLPIALRKYKIQGDWRNYALLVCWDDQERILGLDEKPLIIFKELQDAGKTPVFMLRAVEGAGAQGLVMSATPGGVL